MHPNEAEDCFRSLVAAAKKPDGDLTPADLLDLTIRFYVDYPCEACDPEADADLLLFRCGVYDLGEGENFEVDFARQLIFDGEDGEFEHMLQLHCLFYYPPSLADGHATEFHLWNSECSSLAEFRQNVTEANGFRLALHAKPRRMRIEQHRM